MITKLSKAGTLVENARVQSVAWQEACSELQETVDELLVRLDRESEPLPPEFQKVLNDNLWELYSKGE